MFGGGHVVLPLLQASIAAPGWVTNTQFAAGYGAAQAVPGPLFTFAAYLGAVEGPAPNGLVGAAIALVAIFLPAFQNPTLAKLNDQAVLNVNGTRLAFTDEEPVSTGAPASPNATLIPLTLICLKGSLCSL